MPLTDEGKILTMFYALYGIPVFIWYIVKLGGLFRVVLMRLLRYIWDCIIFIFHYIKTSKRTEEVTSNIVCTSFLLQ